MIANFEQSDEGEDKNTLVFEQLSKQNDVGANNSSQNEDSLENGQNGNDDDSNRSNKKPYEKSKYSMNYK